MKLVGEESIARIIEDAHDALEAEGCTNIITMFVKDGGPQCIYSGLTPHNAHGFAGWLASSADYIHVKNNMFSDGSLKEAKKRAMDEAVDAEVDKFADILMDLANRIKGDQAEKVPPNG